MKLKVAEAAFLVTKDTWYGGLESFVEQHRRPDGDINLKAVHEHLNQQNDPILVDRNYMRHAFVADLMPGIELMTDASLRIKVVTTMIAWLAGSLVLRVRFIRDTDPAAVDGSVDSEEKISALLNTFIRSLEEAVKPSPVLLCRWLFYTDESLDSVNTQDELMPWIEAHVSRTSGDLYASFGTETMILQISETSPTVTFRWYMPQVNSKSYPDAFNEIQAADIYLATDALFEKMKADVENTISNAEKAVEQENPYPVVPGWFELIVSRNPQYHDGLQATSSRISELNHSVLNTQNKLARLESLYSIFHDNWAWQFGSLKLVRAWYARGRLVTTEQDEAGQLTLAEYYRRSGLRIEEFYRHRFDRALQRLLGQLEYLRTVAALRAEQQAAVLNRLVLLLTVVTVFLAALQVLSTFSIFQDYGLFIVAGVFVVAIVGVILAGKRSNHRRRQT